MAYATISKCGLTIPVVRDGTRLLPESYAVRPDDGTCDNVTA